MEEKTKGDAYTIEFIAKKGGVEDVARKTGLNRQTVRQVANGRNAPSFEFIKAMMAAYPDYDLRMTAVKSNALVTSGANATYNTYEDAPEREEASGSRQLIEELRSQIARLEKSNSFLQAIVSKQMGVDFDPIKTESATDSTLGDQLMLNLVCPPKVQKSMMKLNVSDLRPMNRNWPYSFRLSSKR